MFELLIVLLVLLLAGYVMGRSGLPVGVIALFVAAAAAYLIVWDNEGLWFSLSLSGYDRQVVQQVRAIFAVAGGAAMWLVSYIGGRLGRRSAG